MTIDCNGHWISVSKGSQMKGKFLKSEVKKINDSDMLSLKRTTIITTVRRYTKILYENKIISCPFSVHDLRHFYITKNGKDLTIGEFIKFSRGIHKNVTTTLSYINLKRGLFVMNLDDVVNNDFDDYLLSLKKRRDLIVNKRNNLLRIIWRPSLKKDIKLLEKLFECNEKDLDRRDFNHGERDCLINELYLVLEDKIPEKDFNLFLYNCKNVYSYMSVYDKLMKINKYLEEVVV
jgi:hypothetical protein